MAAFLDQGQTAGLGFGRVGEPELTDDGVLQVACTAPRFSRANASKA